VQEVGYTHIYDDILCELSIRGNTVTTIACAHDGKHMELVIVVVVYYRSSSIASSSYRVMLLLCMHSLSCFGLAATTLGSSPSCKYTAAFCMRYCRMRHTPQTYCSLLSSLQLVADLLALLRILSTQVLFQACDWQRTERKRHELLTSHADTLLDLLFLSQLFQSHSMSIAA
jgi:hypothetical protein